MRTMHHTSLHIVAYYTLPTYSVVTVTGKLMKILLVMYKYTL